MTSPPDRPNKTGSVEPMDRVPPRPTQAVAGWFNKLPGFQRAAPGLEWKLWKKLPLIFAVGTVLPLLLAAVVYLTLPDTAATGITAASAADERNFMQFFYLLVGVVVLHWTLVLTLAIGCFIVMLMKGPAYVADGYPLNERDPAPPETQRSEHP